MSKTSQRKQSAGHRLQKCYEAGKSHKPFPFPTATKREIHAYDKGRMILVSSLPAFFRRGRTTWTISELLERGAKGY